MTTPTGLPPSDGSGLSAAETKPPASVMATLDKGADRAATPLDGEQLSSLVARAQEGDAEAFAHLYRCYHGPVCRLTQFYLRESGEDAAAETFLRAWSSIHRYRTDNGTPFTAWLYGIARHVVQDELRAKQRTLPCEHLPERETMEPRDEAPFLRAAIKALPREQRQVIELKYLLGRKNPEVAAPLKKSSGAVNAQHWRARQTLHRLLSGATGARQAVAEPGGGQAA